MMGRAFGGWLTATVVGFCLVGAAGCGSSSTGTSNKCTGTTTGGLGGGLSGGMCATTGGTGGTNTCQVTDMTDTCAVCLAASCCSQTLACVNDAVCSTCQDSTCFQSNQVGTNLLTCAQNSCAQQCM